MNTLDALRAVCATEACPVAVTGMRLAEDVVEIVELDDDGNQRVRVLAAAGAIDADKRKTLIELSLAGKHVELDIDIIAYVQTPGVRNRKFIRFRPDRLPDIARSGVGTPFLRNHEQRELLSAGGTVTASALVTSGEAREIHQTARLTVPWAVQAALQSVLGKFSIGWWPTGAIHCSLCEAPIEDCLWKRGHWRGSEHDGQVVEFIFQDAELIETSAVNIPAVPETRVRGIRSASAHDPNHAERVIDELLALGAHLPSSHPGDLPMPDTRNALARINTKLGLQTEANEAAALAALAALFNERDLARSQLADVTAERNAATTERDQLRARLAEIEASRQNERADAFVQRAVEAGKCALKSETSRYFRDLFLRDEKAAQESLAAAPRVTPVGEDMQSREPASPSSQPAAVPDYKALASQLAAEDLDTARIAGVDAETYVRANYGELADTYHWPARPSN